MIIESIIFGRAEYFNLKCCVCFHYMRKLLKVFTVLCLILFCKISSGQNIVDSIKIYCDLINRHPSGQSVLLGQEELGNWGGHLEGRLYDDSSFTRITWWNAHVSIWQNDFYFKNGFLIMARFSKRQTDYDGVVMNNMKYAYEDKYYFDKGKIIKKEFFGKRSKRERKEAEKNIVTQTLEYKKLLLAGEKKNVS